MNIEALTLRNRAIFLHRA